jgi:hypothetical protein
MIVAALYRDTVDKTSGSDVTRARHEAEHQPKRHCPKCRHAHQQGFTASSGFITNLSAATLGRSAPPATHAVQ